MKHNIYLGTFTSRGSWNDLSGGVFVLVTSVPHLPHVISVHAFTSVFLILYLPFQ